MLLCNDPWSDDLGLAMAGSATAGVGDPIPAGASGPGITGDAPASGDGGGPVLVRHAGGAGDLPIPPSI